MENTNDAARIVLETMRARRSIRDFVLESIPPGILASIASAGSLAPSAGNGQPCRFLVVDDQSMIHALLKSSAEAMFEGKNDQDAKRRFLAWSSQYENASAVILVLEDTESPHPEYMAHDCPLAAANIMLLATAMGYGSTYLTDSICPEGIRRALKIPEHYTPYCAIAIGVPAKTPEQPQKRLLTDIVWRNDIGAPF